MSAQRDIQDAEIVPTTIGQYVRTKFGYWAKRYVGMISLGLPALIAIKISSHGGNTGEWILAGLAAWAIACATALVVIALALSAGGWWHTRRFRSR